MLPQKCGWELSLYPRSWSKCASTQRVFDERVPCVRVVSACPVCAWQVRALCARGERMPCVCVASACPVCAWWFLWGHQHGHPGVQLRHPQTRWPCWAVYLGRLLPSWEFPFLIRVLHRDAARSASDLRVQGAVTFLVPLCPGTGTCGAHPGLVSRTGVSCHRHGPEA